MNVFVSSTYSDLKDFREAVQRSLRQLGTTDISMENFGARDERPKEVCLRLIREESDLFVGIYAYRYGFIPDGDEISITESEYEAATISGLTRLIYLIDEEAPWWPAHIDRGPSEKKLRKLKKRLRADHICQAFLNADDLAAKVVADVGRYVSLHSLTQLRAPGLGPERSIPEILSEAAWPVEVSASAGEFDKNKSRIYEQCRDVFLVHVLAPSKVGRKWYDAYLYLVRHQLDSLFDVDYAEFYLGPYWGGEVFKVQNDKGWIGIKTSAYGSFLCTCRITFKDGFRAFIYRYVDFEMERVAR